MEPWQLDFEWLRVQHMVKDALEHDKLPDLQTVLFLIGIQELGRLPEGQFTKEEKQDLMHVAVCTLLEEDGYYSFAGRDQDGWPHWEQVRAFDTKGVDKQEVILKSKVISYFNVEDRLPEES